MEVLRTDVKLPPRRTDKQDKLAFILDNVLTKEECEALIRETEDIGYEEALLNVGGGRQILATDIRNSERCIVDSVDKADWLWHKLKPFIPSVWMNKPVVGLNERLRFLKYGPGQYFKPHMDGTYLRPDGTEVSMITIQLYLNEVKKGGNTTFLSSHEGKDVGVVPKVGRVLVFQHDILHEGSKLKKGVKYTMRTDVMYKTKEEDKEATTDGDFRVFWPKKTRKGLGKLLIKSKIWRCLECIK